MPLLLSAALLADDATTVQSEGTVTIGVEQVDVDDNSAKYNEYRDREDGLLLDRLWFDRFDSSTGGYFEVEANRVGRQDQSLWLRTGRYDGMSLSVDWNETPHLLSNDAMTPYDYLGNGLFESAGNVPITFKKLATVAADAANVRASDLLIANFLDQYLRGTSLGTQRNRGNVAFDFGGSRAFDLKLSYTDEQRSGSKVTYGPIGDRPPRTLNIEFAEPVDYRTRDLELKMSHGGKSYQLGFTYLLSEFENEIDTLTWENIFATPAPGAEYDVWDRAVSAYGRRPLSPDNKFQQATVDFSAGAPLHGRFAAVFSYGTLEQDENLLPYSYADDVLASPGLPRASAQAEMTTKLASLTYTSNPVKSLNLRAFLRYYELDNDTPESDWIYVTSDTSNLNGTSSYKNRRTNLAYAYDTLNVGAEAQWNLKLWRSALVGGFEREEIGREYREADTSEDRFTLQWRARPSDSWALKARYLFGSRDGDGYDGTVTQQSYWYTPAQVGTDNDNPQFTFSNHPDMRRFDVADRERNQLDLSATWMPSAAWNFTASYRMRDDDFDSDVAPSQPLAGLPLADAALFTPGDQLGLLAEDRDQITFDGSYAPSDRLTLTAFVTFEQANSEQRSMEFNENNKQNPSAVATVELGPWTRATSQWTADSEDDNRTFGVGMEWAITPEKVTLRVDGNWTLGKTDIVYQGFGVTNQNGVLFADNNQYGFRTPPTIRHELTTFNADLDFRLWAGGDLIVGYGYEEYDISDWQQEANTPWFESVGSEYLLRDTSRSHQWGNRLVNMGSYLAPGYTGHYGTVSLAIHF
jgi:MtrB/PioB family decaheme-associated outer membrane protein